MADAFTEHDREVMVSVADVFDPDVPAIENKAYIARVREVRGPIQDRLNAQMQAIRGVAREDAP